MTLQIRNKCDTTEGNSSYITLDDDSVAKHLKGDFFEGDAL
jgi:hypothetical protein